MRDWWIRTALVLRSPRAVFTALRDDSTEAADNRSEPVLLIVWLAGMAVALMTPAAGTLLDAHVHLAPNGTTPVAEPGMDGTVVAIWIFLGGGLLGAVYYLLISGVVHLADRALGAAVGFRSTRHVVAFSAVPVAASLILLPVELMLYGSDMFRSGGTDSGGPDTVFLVARLVFVAWSLGLLGLGLRILLRWPWPKIAGAMGIAALVPLAVTLLAVG